MRGTITSFIFILATGCLSLSAGVTVVHRRVVRPAVVVRAPVVTTRVHVAPARGKIDINCPNKKARVYVNGGYVGLAGQYDGFPGKLLLKPGQYRIKLTHKGSKVVKRVRVTSGGEVNLNVAFAR